MNQITRQRLLDLNRQFYATVADDFDVTRLNLPMGMMRALNYVRPLLQDQATEPSTNMQLQSATTGTQLSVLDAGCGNGRFCWALEMLERPIDYLGIDADARLLNLAEAHTRSLKFVRSSFQPIDLTTLLSPCHLVTLSPCPLVTCFAVLHHMPSYPLRLQIMRWLAAQLQVGGLLLVSTWQFLNSPRLVAKQIDWASMEIDPNEVEIGDALLPWNQGHYAVRYAHQIDSDELQQLANDAGLQIKEIYYADGKEGNLNLYGVLGIGELGLNAG